MVYNLLGMLVKSVEFHNEFIDMSDLKKGSYLLKIYSNDGVQSKMIIKK